MQRTLVLVAALFLIAPLAAQAENPVKGSCSLPDMAGLSPDQIAVAALRAGLTMSPADTSTGIPVQSCPTTFECSSIAGCGSSMVCTVNPIGQCCLAGTVVLCCANTMFVERCPCKCVSEDCPRLCEVSTQVTRSCS
jgi:hypothetical protein